METFLGTPIFCVLTTDKISKRKTYFNFRTLNSIPYPEEDINDDNIMKVICGDGKGSEQYNIPLESTPLFWNKEDTNKDKDGNPQEKFYVIEIRINDKFGLRKVLISHIIQAYLITVTFFAIQEKYNTDKFIKSRCQFIGHELDFDQAGYKILTDRLFMERSNELVNNKIIELINPSGTSKQKNNNIPTYDLYYRPGSRILTFCIRAEKLPESISFNDDRLVVQSGENTLIDICIPIYIDLREPMRFKFDDKLLLLRIVFKTIEKPIRRLIN